MVDGVNTVTPATYYVHTDHLHRPVKMSDASKVMQWSAEYQPWGAVQSLSGPLSLDLRFPGQWFQLEAGLHYNWHRHYDPSLGRYTQPDPLGFVDGPSVYGYVKQNPMKHVDPKGRSLSQEDKELITCGMALIGVQLYCKWTPTRCFDTDDCPTLLTKIYQKGLCILFQETLTWCHGNLDPHGTRTADERRGQKRCEEMAESKQCFQCKAQ